MPIFKGVVNLVKFDDSGFINAIDEHIQVVYMDALRAFLKATLDRVPIKTGMARGSLRPLAEYLNEQIGLAGVRPKPLRNADAGADLAFLDTSEFRFPRYRIKLRIDVIHYRIMEHFNPVFNNLTGRNMYHVPWESFTAGKEAFQQYIAANLKSGMPSIKKYVTKGTEVPFGR